MNASLLRTASTVLLAALFLAPRADLSALAPEDEIRALAERAAPRGDLRSIVVDYPPAGALFPPEMVAPTFLWHDPAPEARRWLVDVRFASTERRVYALTTGARAAPVIDPRCLTETNAYSETEYQATARGWTPPLELWETIKQLSVESAATVTFLGLAADDGAGDPPAIVSRGSVEVRTSRDPVGAAIFYRDVPLMPAKTNAGVIEPLDKSMFPLIQWRLRDLSQPTAPIVMQHLPTCANCHSFSHDGRTLAMDMDGPGGDKGAYLVKDVAPRMMVESRDVITWNAFPERPAGQATFGLFAQISPDGRHVVATLNEQIFVANYPDYRILQTFYPTRGILVVYDRANGTMLRLPGADDPRYVQANPAWSPDGRTIVFARAPARQAYSGGPLPTYAGDPLETQIRYDLYRIPFDGGRGGTPEPIRGASGNGKSNSFPKISPDGKWLVFVRAANGLLLRPDGELYIVPLAGGEARRMRANAAPMNSWHSWSPSGRWLAFTSKRDGPFTRLYLTHVDENGLDTPAILVPDSTAANRAVNIPEFVPLAPGDLVEITTPAVDYRRHLDRARELQKSGRLADARRELDRSLELKSDYWETHVALGDLVALEGRPEEAVEHYRRSLELNPRVFGTHLNLGIALTRIGRYDESLRHLELAAALEPDDAELHVRVGKARALAGDSAAAAKSFARALELDPRSAFAHHEWGLALARAGARDEALEHFRAATEADPGHYWARYQWGLALALGGRVEEAIEVYRATIASGPDYYPAYDSLARLLAAYDDPRLRDGGEAVRLAESACAKTDWAEPRYLDTLAAAYAESGRRDDAVAMAGRALERARVAGDAALVAEIESHLAIFRAGARLRVAFEAGRWRTRSSR